MIWVALSQHLRPIFVAVSIDLSKIIEDQGVAGRAEALALLVGVLFIGRFGLEPNQS